MQPPPIPIPVPQPMVAAYQPTTPVKIPEPAAPRRDTPRPKRRKLDPPQRYPGVPPALHSPDTLMWKARRITRATPRQVCQVCLVARQAWEPPLGCAMGSAQNGLVVCGRGTCGAIAAEAVSRLADHDAGVARVRLQLAPHMERRARVGRTAAVDLRKVTLLAWRRDALCVYPARCWSSGALWNDGYASVACLARFCTGPMDFAPLGDATSAVLWRGAWNEALQAGAALAAPFDERECQ
jgi:hypothetical protein